MADRALYEILAAVDEYLIGVRTLRSLEEWLVARLQSIAKSGDAAAVKLADELDADLVDFSEGDLEEVALQKRWKGYLSRERTVVIPGDVAPVPLTNMAAGSTRLFEWYPLADDAPESETLHVRQEFVG
jgi:hypothetical protein